MDKFDLKKYEKKVDSFISQHYQVSFMSNSKWKKLFKALDLPNIRINHVSLKLVNRVNPYLSYMPKSVDLEEVWVSEGKNSCNYFYKEIEWLELLDVYKPSAFPVQYVYQTVNVAMVMLENLGEYETERTASGLRIYGYKT